MTRAAGDGVAGSGARGARGVLALRLGVFAFILAVLLAGAEVAAILLANVGEMGVATITGQAIIVLTIVPLIMGLVAIFRNRARGWGVAAVLLSIVENPLVLIMILTYFGDL